MEESYYSGSGGSLRTRRTVNEVDPMASVANLSDAMLVFACGLLIALVVAWNLDLSTVQLEIDQNREVADVESLEGALDGSGTTYIQRIVYEDPNTGTLYMLDDSPKGESVESGE